MPTSMHNPKSLGELFAGTVGRYSSKTAFLYKEGRRYIPITWSEAHSRVAAIASALLEKGLKPGERLAILSENRPEWALVDLAVQIIGAVSVPIYTSLTPHEIEYILKDCSAKMIAVSSKDLFEKILPLQASLPDLKAIIAFDSSLILSVSELAIPIFLIKDLQKTTPSEN